MKIIYKKNKTFILLFFNYVIQGFLDKKPYRELLKLVFDNQLST